MVVVGSDPGDCLRRREAVEDGQRGESGPRAADATPASDFDSFAGVCPAMGLAQGVECVGAVEGDPEVGPVDAPLRPCRHWAGGQEQSEVRGANGVAQAPAADSRTGGKGDQPRLVQPIVTRHRLMRAPRLTLNFDTLSRKTRETLADHSVGATIKFEYDDDFGGPSLKDSPLSRQDVTRRDTTFQCGQFRSRLWRDGGV